MKGICILGATGSIGVSTLDVVARHPDKYRVVALTANGNIDALYEQCLAHHPEYAVVVMESKAEEFKQRIAASPVADIKVLVCYRRWLPPKPARLCYLPIKKRWSCRGKFS